MRWDTEEWQRDNHEDRPRQVTLHPVGSIDTGYHPSVHTALTPLECLQALRVWCDGTDGDDHVTVDEMRIYLDAFEYVYAALLDALKPTPRRSA